MTAISQLRAPRENGAIVAEPSLEEIPALMGKNRKQIAAKTGNILGRSFRELCRAARQSAVAAASEYFRQAGEPQPPVNTDSLILSGHQPELFHPGVWVKNFALNRLARENGATPINLVVDNDFVKNTSLFLPRFHLPLPPVEEFTPSLLSIPFDQLGGEIPYEERKVQDESKFSGFADNIDLNWGFRPLLEEFWTELRQQGKRTALLGERFVAARRSFERRWGCHNLEMPVSRLCQTEPFLWFFAHLIKELPRFHHLYNQIVRDYRRRHGIRSRNHPVPDLAREGDWLETPFWGWRVGHNRRERLFALLKGDALVLRAGTDPWPELKAGHALVESALSLLGRDSGFKVRSRALSNTLYARVFLSDLFIHGLGGGKYDELTDDLIRGFYEIEPPGYLVLSATLLLPFPRYSASVNDCRQLKQRLRDLHFNPDRHLDEMTDFNGQVRDLLQQKQEWIEKPYRGQWQRFQRSRHIRELTEQLRSHLSQNEEQLRQQWQRCLLQVKANAILQRRDYAFCLYPEEVLKPFVTQFL